MESFKAVSTAAEVIAEPSATKTAPVTSPPPVEASTIESAPVTSTTPLEAIPTESMTPVVQIASPTAEARTEEVVRRQRGRLRKYASRRSVMTQPFSSMTTPLNLMPISSYMPAGEVPLLMSHRNRGLPVGYLSSTTSSSSRLHHTSRIGFESPGAMAAGTNFTSHIISVAAGQDVTRKIISFAQQRLGAICILSANGTISTVMLSQPHSSGGTMTYEGPFELLSLSGLFMPTGHGGSGDRAGGMSVALAGSEGRVIGGRIGGFLVAATPVQVIVGNFPMPATSSARQPNLGPSVRFRAAPESGSDTDTDSDL